MKALIICGDHIRHRFILEPIINQFSQIRCIVMKRESEITGKKTIANNNSEKKLYTTLNLPTLKPDSLKSVPGFKTNC